MNFVMLTFDVDHVHAGRQVKRGEKREILQYNAEWLIAHGIAHRTPSPTRERNPRRDTTEEQTHDS